MCTSHELFLSIKWQSWLLDCAFLSLMLCRCCHHCCCCWYFFVRNRMWNHKNGNMWIARSNGLKANMLALLLQPPSRSFWIHVIEQYQKVDYVDDGHCPWFNYFILVSIEGHTLTRHAFFLSYRRHCCRCCCWSSHKQSPTEWKHFCSAPDTVRKKE